MPTLTVELTDELYGFVMGREGTTPDETIGAALRYMEFEERSSRHAEPETEDEIGRIRSLLDQGRASGIAAGNVFERVSLKLGLPYGRP